MIGDTLTFSPPLVISTNEPDEIFDRFATAFDETKDWLACEWAAA